MAQRAEPKVQAVLAGKRAELALREPEGLKEPEILARDREAAEPAVLAKVRLPEGHPARMRDRRVARTATPARLRE